MAEHPEAQAIAVKFREAIEFLRRRLNVSTADFDALVRGAEAAARNIAAGQQEAMIRSFLKAVADALEHGTTLADFRQRYAEIVAENGWSYRGNAGWHSQLIFRTNTTLATNAGRWQQAQATKASRPYLRYVTAGDERVRPRHALWQGIVLHVDHPFWATHFPPNGFNCRCHVQTLNERDLARYGFSITGDGDRRLSVPPDPGWSGNVGAAGLALFTALDAQVHEPA